MMLEMQVKDQTHLIMVLVDGCITLVTGVNVIMVVELMHHIQVDKKHALVK